MASMVHFNYCDESVEKVKLKREELLVSVRGLRAHLKD